MHLALIHFDIHFDYISYAISFGQRYYYYINYQLTSDREEFPVRNTQTPTGEETEVALDHQRAVNGRPILQVGTCGPHLILTFRRWAQNLYRVPPLSMSSYHLHMRSSCIPDDGI